MIIFISFPVTITSSSAASSVCIFVKSSSDYVCHGYFTFFKINFLFYLLCDSFTFNDKDGKQMWILGSKNELAIYKASMLICTFSFFFNCLYVT